MSLYIKHKKLSTAVSARPGWQHPFNVVQKRRRALLAAQKKANKKWLQKKIDEKNQPKNQDIDPGVFRGGGRRRSRRRRSRRRSRHRRRRTRRGGRRRRYATNDKYWVIDLQTAATGVKKIAKRHGKPIRKLGHHSKLLLHDVFYGTNRLGAALKGHTRHATKRHRKKSRRRGRIHFGAITALRGPI